MGPAELGLEALSDRTGFERRYRQLNVNGPRAALSGVITRRQRSLATSGYEFYYS
jgi:hypothetical protein